MGTSYIFLQRLRGDQTITLYWPNLQGQGPGHFRGHSLIYDYTDENILIILNIYLCIDTDTD